MKYRSMAAATLLVCTLSNVRDPQSGKIGWLSACGETAGRKTYLGHFDKTQATAMKRAKRWFKAQRPKPRLTVSLQELAAGK